MKLTDRLNELKKSELYKLKYNGNIVGYRCRYFDVKDEKFKRFDFRLDYIDNPDIVSFINSLDCRIISVVSSSNDNMVLNDFEVFKNVLLYKFRNKDEIINILGFLPRIYQYKGGES